jgi:hypothetical protein
MKRANITYSIFTFAVIKCPVRYEQLCAKTLKKAIVRQQNI